ncbi:MAG: hypothetical protein IT462_10095 [Planctomycetes bacterium]|nr:hypothetical protein [Planctomycetota bacterium]
MKRAILTIAAFLALCGVNVAQDAPSPAPVTSVKVPGADQLEALLPYLATGVPELRIQAEARVQLAAKPHFDKLVELMPALQQQGREVLLNILAYTDAPGRVELCVNTICRQDARRRERVISGQALRTVDEKSVLPVLKEKLNRTDLSGYARVQCYRVLGEMTGDDAQRLAEAELATAPVDSLQQFFAEDALLRAIVAAPLADPSWKRYQKRHPEAPAVQLAVLQQALDDLAQPMAVERVEAEVALSEMIGRDFRLLLALARSNQAERAAFGLATLKKQTGNKLTLATQAVMLDLALGAEQTIALLAVDVAIAGTPPSPADLDKLRPLTGIEAIAKLEAVLEGLAESGDLATLRKQRARAEAILVPMLRRNGTSQGETSEAISRLEAITAQLEELERRWRGGWRREFEREILGVAK